MARLFGGQVYELPRDYARLLDILHFPDPSAQAYHVAFDDPSNLTAFASRENPLITSGTAQEAVDMAVAASQLAIATKKPVLHAFPKAWVGDEFAKLEIWNAEMWSDFTAPRENPGELFDAICRHILRATGRTYADFEYCGASSADSVSVGLACEVLTENSLKVRLWRPFNGRRFLENLPATTASFTVGKLVHADVLTAVHEGIVGGWSWFVHLPPIHMAVSGTPVSQPETGFRAIITPGENQAEIETAIHEMFSDLSTHVSSAFQCYSLTEEKPSLHVRIAPEKITARGPVHNPQLTLHLSEGRLRISGSELENIEIDAASIAKKSGLGTRLGPVVVSVLLYFMNCEVNLKIPESKARDLMNEAFEERWSEFSEDIVTSHERAFELTRRSLAHPDAACAESPRNASILIPLKRDTSKTPLRLVTNYLGFRLNSPIVASVDPRDDLEIADLGSAGAVFFGPISEDDLDREAWRSFQNLSQGRIKPGEKIRPPIERYVEKLRAIKEAVEVPVIAGLEAIAEKNWLSLAFALEQGGADALEIFLKSPEEGGPSDARRIAALTATALKIPVALRITPALAHLAEHPDDLGGAKGFVLFRSPVGGIVDPSTLELREEDLLPGSQSFRLALPALRRLSEIPHIDLAAAGPIETVEELLQALLAGARAVYANAKSMDRMNSELKEWMKEKGLASIGELEILHGQEKYSAV